MKKLALFLALIMAFSCVSVPSMAESTDAVRQSASGFYYVEADAVSGQKRLSASNKALFIQADGLYFKDLNGNGTLDVYEDWRKTTDERAADLIAQMTVEEKSRFMLQTDMPKEVGTADDASQETVWYYVNHYGITHMLDNNGAGTPDQMANRHNGAQAATETTRLGIPVTVTSDRQYNAWAGYIDTAHDAIGTAHDVELETAILSAYAKESAATGVHVTLQPYGVEIGSWYGEDPEYIAKLTAAEVEAYQSNGVFTCVKHFITRGGDQSFQSGQSIAANVENYMVGWKAAINAGTRWIMTNSAGGGLDGLNIDFSRESMTYLRETLGYDGVVVTDWGSIGYAAKGIDADGVDLAMLSNPERYAYEVNNGVDQLGINNATDDAEKASGSCYNVNDMYEAVASGLISTERINQVVLRLLRTKFDLGLFENAYCDPAAALALAATEEYVAQPWELTDMDTLAAARKPELVEAERKLQAESAVLVKNEDNILPLQKGVKVYIDSTNGTAIEQYKRHISDYATVVSALDEADVVVADCTRIDDAAEQLVNDAIDAGKKLVIVANCVDPDAWMIESADAVLFMNFTRVPDHGTAQEGFIFTTEPVVFAELLFGDRQPTGMIVKEIARDAVMDGDQWQDLAGDQGTGLDVRMLLEAIMLSSENHTTPNNYGDPLLQYRYGMRYGEDAAFRFTTLVVPTEQKEIKVNLFLDFWSTQMVTLNATQKSGEPFTVYCIVWNDGSDGMTDVQVLDGDQVIATKTMAVTGGSWRIFKMDVTLEGAGEHTLTVGDLSTVITVE